MPSINVDLFYFDHPKTKRLVGRLGRGAEVLPLKLWTYCAKVHARDGLLAGYTAPEIEKLVEWWGKPGDAIAAMIAVGFLAEAVDGYACHDWIDWQGHIYAYHVRAKKAAAEKYAKLRGDACSTPVSTPSSTPSSILDGSPSSSVQFNTCIPPISPASGGRRESKKDRENREFLARKKAQEDLCKTQH